MNTLNLLVLGLTFGLVAGGQSTTTEQIDNSVGPTQCPPLTDPRPPHKGVVYCDTVQDTEDGSDERRDLCVSKVLKYEIVNKNHTLWSMGYNYNEFEHACKPVDDGLDCTLTNKDIVFIMNIPSNITRLHISHASRVFLSKHVNINILILTDIDFIDVTEYLPNVYQMRNDSMEVIVERSTINILPSKTIGVYMKEVKAVIMNLESTLLRAYAFQTHILNLHTYSNGFASYYFNDVSIDNVEYFHSKNSVLRFDNVVINQGPPELFVYGHSIVIIRQFKLQTDNYKVYMGPYVVLINRDALTTTTTTTTTTATTEDYILEQLKPNGNSTKNIIFIVSTIICVLLIIAMFVLLYKLVTHPVPQNSDVEYQSVNQNNKEDPPPTYNSVYPQNRVAGGSSRWSMIFCIFCLIFICGAEGIATLDGNNSIIIQNDINVNVLMNNIMGADVDLPSLEKNDTTSTTTSTTPIHVSGNVDYDNQLPTSTPDYFYKGIRKLDEVRCKEDEYRCINKQCIKFINRCDGIPDCDDMSDELYCTQCSAGFFCSDHQCIRKSYICDGIVDCANDEVSCCSTHHGIQCDATGRCFNVSNCCDDEILGCALFDDIALLNAVTFTPLIAFGIAFVVTVVILGFSLLMYWYCRIRYNNNDDNNDGEIYDEKSIEDNSFLGKTYADIHHPSNVVPAVPVVTENECIVDVLRDMKPDLPPKQRPLAMRLSAPEASRPLREPLATTPLISAVSTDI